MWAYFAPKTGWLKINVGTNLGPQIYVSLPYFLYLASIKFQAFLGGGLVEGSAK